MQLLLIRHAESVGNREGRMQGQGSDPLTEQGQEQARCLGQHWATQERSWPTALYCSPLRRSQQTAEIIRQVLIASNPASQQIAPPLHVHPDLREFNHGILEGLTWAEAQQQYPDLCAQLMSTPTWLPIPAAESLQSGRDRAQSFLTHLLQRHTQAETIGVISHHWILQHLIAVLLGCDRTWQIPIQLTGVFEFVLDRDRWDEPGIDAFNSSLWQIRRFNDTSHLLAHPV